MTGDPFENLRIAIIKQAADDWRDIINGKEVRGQSLDEIRHFLKSEWGETLCAGQNYYILRKLEDEL